MAAQDNPLLNPSSLPFGMPDFASIKPEHFRPAFFEGMRRQKKNLDAVANNPAPATFENTIIPLELAKQDLQNVAYIFSLLAGTRNTPQIEHIQQKIMPVLSCHGSAQSQREDVFVRVKAVYNDRAELAPDQRRLVEDYYIAATHAGIGQPETVKRALSSNSAALSKVGTEFSTRIMGQTDKVFFVVENENELAGVPENMRRKAANRANQNGLDGKYAFTLMRTEMDSFLTVATNRDARRRYFEEFSSRNDNGDAYDTNDLVSQATLLKQERARLLGYKTYADMALEHNMARTPQNAMQLMIDLWEPAKAKFAEELAERQQLAAAEGMNEPLQPWDWAYYTEKLRQKKYALDDNEVTKYLRLENVQAAMFDVSERLFGVTFTRREDIITHHPDAKAWEVRDENGKHLAVFIDDFFARQGKRSGALKDNLRCSHGLGEGQRPIVYNMCNFTKPEDGKPALLSMDDAIALIHEGGHALHEMRSRVVLPSQGGTRVKRDNVELPSQFMEHYLTVPEIMEKHFRHVDTGAPMPKEMIEKIKASSNMDAGFDMTRYLISALIDLEVHQQSGSQPLNLKQFEADMLKKYDMPESAPQAHRLPHFHHSFNGYSAQYYVYRWANVYDYDAFAAFEETGNPFDPATARRLDENIYQTGNSRAPDENYRAFRGRDATREAFLKGKGFIPA